MLDRTKVLREALGQDGFLDLLIAKMATNKMMEIAQSHIDFYIVSWWFHCIF